MTAKEFWDREYRENGISLCNENHVEILMIEFAKYHVVQAIWAAMENASTSDGHSVNKESIFNAYLLKNIK